MQLHCRNLFCAPLAFHSTVGIKRRFIKNAGPCKKMLKFYRTIEWIVIDCEGKTQHPKIYNEKNCVKNKGRNKRVKAMQNIQYFTVYDLYKTSSKKYSKYVTFVLDLSKKKRN